jgi:DNA modification methylase
MQIRLSDTATLFHDDCREALRSLPDNSVDSCVTDPPYALVSIVKRFGKPGSAPAKGNDSYMRASRGFMSCTWDTGETAFSAEFWVQIFRVLKPGGHVVAFGATRGYHRMACAIEDAGFEIRDSLMWLYATGFPKSHDVSKGINKAAGHKRGTTSDTRNGPNTKPNTKGDKFGGGYLNQTILDNGAITPESREWEGWGTALKPAFEPIVLARKPLSEKTVAANVLKWGTGALNIDASRIDAGGEDQRRPSSGGDNGLSGTSTFKIRARSVDEQKVQGRFPANVLHDGSDEVIEAFSVAGGQQGRAKIGGEKAGSIYGKFGENRSSNPEPRNDSGSAARFFYSAKANKQDRAGSNHPTVKPISLMEWLCTLITPPGGTILDPFAGSGTTGAAARNKGFRCVLVEREDEYVVDIRRRLGTPTYKSLVVNLQAVHREHDAARLMAELQSRVSARA